jgi:hypothetical protein
MLPALKQELPMEDRVPKLEIHVERMSSDVGEMKVEIRELRNRIDGVHASLSTKIDGVQSSLTARIDGVQSSLSAKIDDLRASLDAKIDAKIEGVRGEIAQLRDGLASAKIWALLIAGAVFAVLARGFKWI